MTSTIGFGLSVACFVNLAVGQDKPSENKPATVAEQIAHEVIRVKPTINFPWVRKWAEFGSSLPTVKPFSVEVGGKSIDVDENLFYVGRFGSPLAYSRVLDLLAKEGVSGLDQKRILDFGYGSISSVRMMAMAGADVTGVDVSPLLEKMYAGHQGSLAAGNVRLVHGRFPKDPAIIQAVGEGYDLIISKNTLKRGYIHPARKIDPRMSIDLGVSDENFLATLHQILKPGGFAVVYNFCPAQSSEDQPYIPAADGESPFTRTQWTKAGFEVVHFDVQDNKAARELASALGWDQGEGAMQLEKDLFAWFTIVKK